MKTVFDAVQRLIRNESHKMTPEELYSQNDRLVWWAMKKYYPDFMDDEDLIQEGRIGLSCNIKR